MCCHRRRMLPERDAGVAEIPCRGGGRREMARSNPTLAMLISIEEPPKLIKGSGIPVNGTEAVTTPMLINA